MNRAKFGGDVVAEVIISSISAPPSGFHASRSVRPLPIIATADSIESRNHWMLGDGRHTGCGLLPLRLPVLIPPA